MIIGCLGSIPFYVTHHTVQTINNMVLKRSVSYSTHQRVASTGLVELTGYDPLSFTFDMHLTTALGVKPKTLYDKLDAYAKSSTTLPLVLGNEVLGDYRWVIKSLQGKTVHSDWLGRPIYMTASVGLLEYQRN